MKGLAAGMISSFIGDVLVAFVLLHFILWSGAATWLMGAFVGFICGWASSRPHCFRKASTRTVPSNCSPSMPATGSWAC